MHINARTMKRLDDDGDDRGKERRKESQWRRDNSIKPKRPVTQYQWRPKYEEDEGMDADEGLFGDDEDVEYVKHKQYAFWYLLPLFIQS